MSIGDENMEKSMTQHLQQQIEELRHKDDNSKRAHKLEITKVNKTLTSSTEEIY